LDAQLHSLALLTEENVASLQALEPFGAGNPRPTFLLEEVRVESCVSVGGGRHTRLQLYLNGARVDAIFFSVALQDTGLHPGSLVDAAFYPQINDFRGSRTVQLLLTDLRRSADPLQRQLRLYRRYVAGELLSPAELGILIPQRSHFVALWRYLEAVSEDDMVTQSPAELTRRVTEHSGTEQSCATTMVCLEVFRERRLIDLTVSEKTLLIRLRRGTGKVNLDESAVLRRLRSYLEYAAEVFLPRPGDPLPPLPSPLGKGDRSPKGWGG
jgi:single-stranded-DNA-specific exonuclease